MTPFASGLNFYKLFWIFFIGCFIGVVIEELWCMVRYRKIESRKGLIYGPFNLVYGFGALIITVSLIWFSDKRDIVIFAFGAAIGGVYEYLCSALQEKFLGSISWNYQRLPFSLNGRINLLYCFFWGLLAIFWIKDLYPYVSALVERIPNNIGVPLTYALLFFMVLNSLISALAVYRMSIRKTKHRTNAFWDYIDNKYPDEKMEKIYPNMQFVRK